MARILINECKQEISSFNPVMAGYEDFAIDRGEAVLGYHRRVHAEVGGALRVLEGAGHEVEGGYAARGITSSGLVRREAFERIAAEFLEPLRWQRNWDGIYFALHGALAAEGVEDCEGELLARARAIVGEAMPIVVSLDLHGILTDRIVELADGVVVFHTNPHTDFFETGERAARLLLRILKREVKPVSVRVPIPALVRGPELMTESGIWKRWVDETIAFEREPGGLAGGFFIGNPFTDVADLASNVFLVADGDERRACELGVRIAGEFWRERATMQQPLLTLEQSAELARRATGRVVLVDAADATSSGASGDSNAIVAELVRQGNTRTVLAPLVDAPAVEHCYRAGAGAEVELTLGGSLDPRFVPLTMRGRVALLFDGKLCSESYGEGWYAGPSAVFESEPYTIVLTARPVHLYDRTLFLAAGRHPFDFDMTVVKSPLCQPRFFNDGAQHVLNIDAPGATSANVRSLGHRAARRPLFPLDDGFEYTPAPRVYRRT